MGRREVLLVLALAGAGLTMATGSRPAAACSCVEQTPAEQVASADAVFVATADGGPREVGGSTLAYELEVEAVHVGEVDAVVEVRTGRGDGDCGIDLSGRHLVFAHRDDEGRLSTGLCSGTRPLADGEQATGVGPGRVPDPPPTVAGPPIGGPEGDVEDADPSPGELLAGVGLVVLVAGGVAVLVLRRRRSATSRAG